MHLNSVSLASQSFEGKNRPQQKRMVEITPEKFANMDDRDLKILANITAANQVNDKKHRKINNTMFALLPTAGGLAVLAGSKGLSRLGKLGAFFGGSMAMTAGLFAVDKMLDGKNALERKIPKLREVREKHPMLTMGATIAGLFAALTLGGRGLVKAANKLLPKVTDTKLYAKVAPKVTKGLERASKFLDNHAGLNKVSKLVHKLPSSIKSAAKWVASYSPAILAGGIFAHGLNHVNVRNRVAMDNFVQLKEAQEEVRQNLMDSEIADRMAAEEV